MTQLSKHPNLKTPSSLTARDWQLFRDLPGCGKAVKALNSALSKALREKSSTEAVKIIFSEMRKYREYGATDSEAYYLVDEYIEAVFAE